MSGAGNIDIKPAELRNLATSIAQQRDRLNDQITFISQQMNSLRGNGWDSQAGELLRERFERLRAHYMQKYPPSMQSYIEFLNRTADEYESTEQNRISEVQNLTNLGIH